MSLNEIAVDLTCQPEPFEPPTVPGTDAPAYHVHGGILRMARAMGDAGKPVQLAVQEALHNNPDFGKAFRRRWDKR